jgi:hypothetical protein
VGAVCSVQERAQSGRPARMAVAVMVMRACVDEH